MGRLNADKEYSFWDHLDEARSAVIRCLLYITAGTSAAWVYRQWFFAWVQWPALVGARRAGLSEFHFRVFEPAGGLMLMMSVALIAGLLVSAPAWLAEIVRFVTPALTPQERRAARLMIPLALLLFVGGVAFCYVISPLFFQFLFAFNRSLGVTPEVALVPYLRFFVQMMVVFGLSFELPLLLMVLVFLGLVSSQGLLQRWRGAVVIIVVIAAVVTPTVDPVTMTLMAAPMVLLYFLSIYLARLVERGGSTRAAATATAAGALPADPDYPETASEPPEPPPGPEC